jgi:hypothetical protein
MLTPVADEASCDVELLAAHNNDTLTTKKLLRDDGGKATKQVATAINDNPLLM